MVNQRKQRGGKVETISLKQPIISQSLDQPIKAIDISPVEPIEVTDISQKPIVIEKGTLAGYFKEVIPVQESHIFNLIRLVPVNGTFEIKSDVQKVQNLINILLDKKDLNYNSDRFAVVKNNYTNIEDDSSKLDIKFVKDNYQKVNSTAYLTKMMNDDVLNNYIRILNVILRYSNVILSK